MMSLRKSASDTSAPRAAPSCQTLPAHCSKAVSSVIPRSSVIASYSFRPGDLRLVEGSAPSRNFTTSVERFNPVTLLIPATYFPSHFTWNLKFLYGSWRVGFTVNSAINIPPWLAALAGCLSGHLLDLDHHKLGWIKRSKPNHNIDHTVIDVGLRGGLA